MKRVVVYYVEVELDLKNDEAPDLQELIKDGYPADMEVRTEVWDTDKEHLIKEEG